MSGAQAISSEDLFGPDETQSHHRNSGGIYYLIYCNCFNVFLEFDIEDLKQTVQEKGRQLGEFASNLYDSFQRRYGN